MARSNLAANPQSQHPADHTPSVWNAEYEKIAAEMFKSATLKKGTAAEIGRRNILYIRPKDMLYWLFKNQALLKSFYGEDRLQEMLQNNEPYKLTKKEGEYAEGFNKEDLRPIDFVPLCESLLRLRFYYRADKQEFKTQRKGDEEEELTDAEDQSEQPNAKNEKNSKLSRWPNRLVPYPMNSQEAHDFTLTSFYVIAYESDKSNKWGKLMLASVVMAVLILVMFPAWPSVFKHMGAYISIALLTLMLFITVIRLVCFIILWYGGFDFWIMPNFFADDLPILDCFRPLYIFSSRNDGYSMYLVRAFAFVLMSLSFVKLNETHSLRDMGEFATQQYLEFVEWGVDKIAGIGEEVTTEQNKNPFGLADDIYDIDDDEDDEEEDITVSYDQTGVYEDEEEK